jgi:hypothetical protein
MTAALGRKVPMRVEHTGNASGDRAQRMAQQVGQSHEVTKTLVAAISNYAGVDLTQDTTTSSTALVPLLAVGLKTLLASGSLLITFSASFNKATIAGPAVFVVNVDGVSYRGCVVTCAAAASDTAHILLRVPVKAGAHTVTVLWQVNSGTLRIATKTVPLNEFATLLVQEAA